MIESMVGAIGGWQENEVRVFKSGSVQDYQAVVNWMVVAEVIIRIGRGRGKSEVRKHADNRTSAGEGGV